MINIIIFDENRKEIDRYDLNYYHNSSLKKFDNVPEFNDINKDILNDLDYLIGIFKPVDTLDDFYIIFLNDTLLEFFSLSLDDAIGMYASDIYNDNNEHNTLLNIMLDVYNTNQSRKLFIEYYNNNILIRSLNIKISRHENNLFYIAKDETDYAYLSMKQKILFKNEFNAIAIIQDGCLVNVNNQYLEVYGQDSFEDVIGKKIGFTGLDKKNVNKLNDSINKIIEGKLISYITTLEIKKKGKLLRYFIIDGNYIVHNGKPAVMAIHHDITQDELNRREIENKNREALVLETNLDFIQSVSNIALIQVRKSNYLYSSKVYDIIERNQLDNDINRNILWDFIVDEDKPYVKESIRSILADEKSVDGTIKIKTAKGNLKYIHYYVNINKINPNINFIIFCQDVTSEQLYLKKLENTLKEKLRLEYNLNRIQSISKTAIGYSDNLYSSEWTPEIFDLLEIDPNNYINDTNNLIERFVIEEDKELRDKCVKSLSPKTPDVIFKQRVKTGNDNIKYIKTVMHHEYKQGKLINRVSFNQDITQQTGYENKLENALKDRGILLSEVHHRVKNNLQIILSLINLNMNYDKKPDQILSDTQDRIYSMALIHEKIYGSNSLSAVNMNDYTKDLVKSLFDLYNSEIVFHPEIEAIELDMEEAIPLGLIINELVNNTIKYAFPDDNSGNLYIKFRKENNHYIFLCYDDGVGLPEDFNLSDLSSLGLIVVKSLTTQIGGKLSIIDCKGTGFKIEFDE